MFRIERIVIVFLIADSAMFNLISSAMANVAQSFEANDLPSDLGINAPQALVTVTYPGDVSVQLGNQLSPLQVQKKPCVSYKADPNKYYTLVFTDPDVAGRELRVLGEVKHWLVGNIPGCDVEAGETLAPYLGSIPPPATGLHRYTYLVYQQPGKLTFDDESLLLNIAIVDRVGFSAAEFAEKYDLGDPIAGNFFLCEFDVSVDIGLGLDLSKLLGN